MAFIQPCFIRKNTPELREKLRELGYIISDTLVITNFDEIICYDNISYGCEYPCEYRQKSIDCGTNEELFLALAALRDDTRDFQWFIWDDENDYDEGDDGWKQYIPGEHWEDWWWFEVRKATIKEIIDHFKK